jgi:hypothetical protein
MGESARIALRLLRESSRQRTDELTSDAITGT